MAFLDIKLDKVDRFFEPKEKVTGVVVVHSETSLTHGGIQITLDGTVTLQLSARSVGLFEAFSSSIKPITVMQYSIDIHKGGKLQPGQTEFPFEFIMKPMGQKSLYETYHGVYVNINYMLTADMKGRGMLAKNCKKRIEITCQIPDIPKNYKTELRKKIPFKISPETLQNVRNKSKVPKFLIDGTFYSGVCEVNKPFTGEIFVRETEVDVKSIELQFVRVETCAYTEGDVREATEVQNIQLAEGNVCKNFGIPIYMVFPRLFTCATTITKNFKIEFEVNIVVLFTDGHMLTENFPIKLIRGRVTRFGL